MKKTLAILLALIMALSVSLMACTKDKDKDNDDDDDWDDGEYNYNPVTSDAEESTGSYLGGDDYFSSGVWVEKNDTVYVGIDNTNIRDAASTSSEVIATVKSATALTRTATNGTWDKVTYDSKECYVRSALVTTDANDFSFEDCDEEVALTVKEGYQVNLRTTPFYDQDYSDANLGPNGLDPAATANGELVKVAVSKSGDWYKVKYDGKTYYLAYSNITSGYVSDPTVTVNPGSGATGVG